MYLLNHQLTNTLPNNLHEDQLTATALLPTNSFTTKASPRAWTTPSSATCRAKRDPRRWLWSRGGGGDFDGDGWPDLYVANDYLANDVLWINNHDGTFTNRIASALRHQSYSSMGVDAADVNNDGTIDIITLDMQPEPASARSGCILF